MNPLYIYFHGANQQELSGETSTVVRGCRYNPGLARPEQSAWGEVVTEKIELQLEGTAAELAALVTALEKWVELAGNEPVARDYVYLRFYDGSTFDWRSRIVGGFLVLGGLGPVDRDRGSQVVILQVIRLNYWFAPKKLAKGYLEGVAEPTVVDALYELQSHQDGSTSCTAYVDGDSMDGSLISPLEVQILIVGSDAFEQVVMCGRVLKERAADVGYIEGEDLTAGAGVTRTVTAAALDSAGYYGRFAWSGAGETLLCSKSIAAADLEYYRGMLHKTIMRLESTHAYTDLWICAKVLAGGTSTVLAESLWQLSPAGSKYQEIPAVAIPPDLAGYEAFGSVDYAIYVKRTAGGSCQVDIDFIYLAPAENIRKLTPLVSVAGGTGKYLIDSNIDEKTYFLNASGQALVTHTGAGERFWLYPGYHMAIKIFLAGGGLALATLHVTTNVGIWYEPRKRII